MASDQKPRDYFADLSNEILMMIAGDTGLKTGDIAAFAATSRHNYAIGNPILYKKHVKEEGGVVCE